MATILVIDDEPIVADLLTDLLVEAGHDVLTAVNGSDGLRCAREMHPDLIISDIMMPELDGHGLVRELGADPHLSNTPVVLMSAGPSRLAMVEPPVIAFLPKPFHIDHLFNLLDDIFP